MLTPLTFDQSPTEAALGLGVAEERDFTRRVIEDDTVGSLDTLCFKNCVFRRVVFQGEIGRCRFNQCHFENCSFRDVVVKNTQLTGCAFFHCNLLFRSCFASSFLYASFDRCAIDSEVLRSCSPTEANLRERFYMALKANATSNSDGHQIDYFQELEILARKEKLWTEFSSNTDYYRKSFGSLRRMKSLMEYTILTISGFVWGHGLSTTRLLTSFILFTTFALLLITATTGDFRYSVELLVNTISGVTVFDVGPVPRGLTVVLVTVYGFFLPVFYGFLAALIFRKVLK